MGLHGPQPSLARAISLGRLPVRHSNAQVQSSLAYCRERETLSSNRRAAASHTNKKISRASHKTIKKTAASHKLFSPDRRPVCF